MNYPEIGNDSQRLNPLHALHPLVTTEHIKRQSLSSLRAGVNFEISGFVKRILLANPGPKKNMSEPKNNQWSDHSLCMFRIQAITPPPPRWASLQVLQRTAHVRGKGFEIRCLSLGGGDRCLRIRRHRRHCRRRRRLGRAAAVRRRKGDRPHSGPSMGEVSRIIVPRITYHMPKHVFPKKSLRIHVQSGHGVKWIYRTAGDWF